MSHGACLSVRPRLASQGEAHKAQALRDAELIAMAFEEAKRAGAGSTGASGRDAQRALGAASGPCEVPPAPVSWARVAGGNSAAGVSRTAAVTHQRSDSTPGTPGGVPTHAPSHARAAGSGGGRGGTQAGTSAARGNGNNRGGARGRQEQGGGWAQQGVLPAGRDPPRGGSKARGGRSAVAATGTDGLGEGSATGGGGSGGGRAERANEAEDRAPRAVTAGSAAAAGGGAAAGSVFVQTRCWCLDVIN